MSSKHVTVRDLIGRLKTYDPDLLVVVEDRFFNPLEAYEGCLNGPTQFDIVPVCDLRSGMSPVEMVRYGEKAWDVLLIRCG
jgi:hypothetical protein